MLFPASNQSLTSGLTSNPFRRAEWDKHLLYIYRIEPGPSTPVDKYAGYLVMPSGAQVPINDREGSQVSTGCHIFSLAVFLFRFSILVFYPVEKLFYKSLNLC